MNSQLRFLPVFFMVLIFSGCGKDELALNLKRNGKNDARQNSKITLFDYIDCNSLLGFSGSPGWQNMDGYIENGLFLGNSTSASLLFSRATEYDFVITFWTKSINPGFPNIKPEVIVDGEQINSVITDGSDDYGSWMKVQTASIAKGSRNIEIRFVSGYTFYNYYIDEICLYR
jgi:hypothetical protein